MLVLLRKSDRPGLFANETNNDAQQSSVRVTAKHIVDNALAGAFGVHGVDIDGDRDLDILGAARDEDWVVWYENDGNQNFTKQSVSEEGGFDGPRTVQTADFDNDGDLDVVSAALKGGEVAWWLNNGNGEFTKQQISNLAGDVDSPYGCDLADVDSDGDLDVLAADQFDNDIVWWEMQ